MTQRDVVLRWIEQIAGVVRRMLLGPGPADLNVARAHVVEATEQLLGPLALLVPRLDARSAAGLLRDPERVFGLAFLLELEAEIAAAAGNDINAAQLRSRAAELRAAAPTLLSDPPAVPSDGLPH